MNGNGREEKLRALSVIICEVPAALLPCATLILDIFNSIGQEEWLMTSEVFKSGFVQTIFDQT